MNKLTWKPLHYESDITSLGRTSSFYLLEGVELSFLFIHEANKTSVLIISLDEHGSTIYHVIGIESYNFISKITGNNNYIFMLNNNCELFYLKGMVENDELTFNFTNAIRFLSSNVVLTWCKIATLTNCLALQAVSSGVACLYHDDVCIFSAFYNATDICNGLTKLTNKRLNYFHPNGNYFMMKITGENAKLINKRTLKVFPCIDEVLLIIEPTQLRFSKPAVQAQICSKLFPIDFGTDSVMSVINFNKEASIFIICNSGKIVCLKLKSFELNQFFLKKKVYAVTGYEDVKMNLLWSDLKNLYLSRVSDNGEIIDLQVTNKIGGVVHLVISSCNLIMAITRNGCLYETRSELIKNKLALPYTRIGWLERIHKTAETLENLIKEIKDKEYFMKALEISKLPIKSNNIYVNANNDTITLKNNTNFRFEREFWKIQFEMEGFQNKELEIKELNNSILPGGNFNCPWNGKNYLNLKVTLFCDIFLPQAVIFIEVEVQFDKSKSYGDGSLADYSQHLIDTYKFYA